MIYAERIKEINEKLNNLYKGTSRWAKIRNAAADFGCHPNTMYHSVNTSPKMPVIKFFRLKQDYIQSQRKIASLEDKIKRENIQNQNNSLIMEKENGHIVVKKVIKKIKIDK